MTNENPKKSGSELFIVDNSDQDWKVRNYLHDWCDIAVAFDIATAYFEIGSLLALDGQWQKLDQIRILMGDEVSKRTQEAFERGLAQISGRLDQSLEAAKDADDFLGPVPAIVQAIHDGKIQTRVYRKQKFHAKAYITHHKLEVVGAAALVGSSNFTLPGLTNNVELNIQIRREVEELQEWYERHWNQAEDVSADILRVIERHTREYTPFEVYARALAALFEGHALTVSEWEQTQSRMYPVLDQYQRDGYHQMMKIAQRYKGALLCDGVGLGKTFIGLMVIERLLHEGRRVALLVPKRARRDVWEVNLRRYLPEAFGRFTSLAIYNHTDLLRGGQYPEFMQEIAEEADALVIDEAHHFRNISSQRSRKLFDITAGKQIFMLTATPINNSLYDLMHLIELFSRREPGYFREAPLGIHTLRGHFRRMEEALDALVGADGAVEMDARAAEQILSEDHLFRELVVQRSRAYVKRSLGQDGETRVAFPNRQPPQVAHYSLEETYGGLLDSLERAFKKDKPLMSLALYNPMAYALNTEADGASQDQAFEAGRQMQVVGLVRTQLLKRFESSAAAFQASCEDLLIKMLCFIDIHNPKTAQRWQSQHAELMERIHRQRHDRDWGKEEEEEKLDEDVLPEEIKSKIEKLDEAHYNVAAIVMETLLDLDQLAEFLEQLYALEQGQDDKLNSLVKMLRNDATLQTNKVLIFTEFIDTARYMEQRLRAEGLGPLDEVDSRTRRDSSQILRGFSPYYNGASSADLAQKGLTETRILISTDVLSEGLNLQDATCIINYDLHWNPVRLMQRIGRVDRRLDPAIEARMIADHPELKGVRGSVCVWNFLPPAELDRLLSLYQRVAHKTLRISKTFGIEGRKLLTPEDDYEALREFNQAYEGTPTSAEEMHLAYQQLLHDHPGLADKLAQMPLRVFSGKAHPTPGARGIFFCYRLPAKDAAGEWNEEASFTKWYLFDLEKEKILEDAARIFQMIRCEPDTPRQVATPRPTLTEIRRTLDAHVKNTYLKKVQAPQGINSTLLAWMELS